MPPVAFVRTVALTSGARSMTGGSVSLTITWNDAVAVFPDASRAVHVTVVVPSGNRLPDKWLHAEVTPGALSLTIGAAKVTAALAWPASLLTVLFGGTVMVGGCVSTMRIVKLALTTGVVLAEHVTSVVPIGKKEPLAGEHVMVPHVPEVVGAE